MPDAKVPSLSELIKRQMALRAAIDKDPRYRPDAYLFVCEGVDYTCSRLDGRRDVSGRELIDGLCDLAIEHFGFLAPTVLERWGIRSTEDFGEIVFILVEFGLLGRSARDSKADFQNVFDLRAELRSRYCIEPELDN